MALNTHSEYVILIAFPQQRWLCEKASMLCYTYTAYLVGNDRRLILCSGTLIIVDVMQEKLKDFLLVS